MESHIVKRIRKALKQHFGGIWWKSHGGPFQVSGKGDIIGCCKGYYFNLEVKQDKKGKKYEPTELQQKEIDDVNKEGGCGACVKSVEQAVKVVGEYLESKALCISEKRDKKSNKVKIDWSMDGTGNREDNHSTQIYD